jgi:hypothetical protein
MIVAAGKATKYRRKIRPAGVLTIIVCEASADF